MVTFSIWLSVWLSFTVATSSLIFGYLWFSTAADQHGELAPARDRRGEPLELTAVYEVVPQKITTAV